MVVQRSFTDRPRLLIEDTQGEGYVTVSSYERYWVVTRFIFNTFSPRFSEWWTTSAEVHARVVQLTGVPVRFEDLQEDLNQLEFVSRDFPQTPRH